MGGQGGARVSPPLAARGRPGGLALLAFLALALAASAAVGGGSAGAPHLPGAGFTVRLSDSPGPGVVPLREIFSATPSTGTPSEYGWSFGDGQGLNGSASGDATPVHTYEIAGQYTVEVTIFEGAEYASANLTVVVGAGPLAASIQATPISGAVPLTVVFGANVSGGTGTYVAFVWSFGDGGQGLGPEVANTYRSPGTYEVRLTINDSRGTSVNANLTIQVRADPPPPTPGLSSTMRAAALLAGSGVVGFGFAAFWVYRGGSRSDLLIAGGSWAPLPEPDPAEVGPTGPSPPIAPRVLPGAPTTHRTEPDEPSAPLPAAPVSNGARRELQARRRLSHQLILRLAQLGRLGPEETPDLRWTQQGLGAHVGVAQNRASNVLRRLEAAGVVDVETRHVVGAPRRVKVYRLTGRGEDLARAYRLEAAPKPPRRS
jgi:DNA-binding MarR family transcriptional regulator